MPRGDGSGPMGMGPMTGRAAGYCAGYGVPGFMNPGFGYGRGRGGMGRGMGWRRGWGGYPAAYGVPPVPPVYGAYPAAPTSEQEVAALKQQAEAMRQGLDQVQSRIAELEKGKDT